MNADKLSVKTYAVEISLPIPDVFLKVWTKGDKDQTGDVLEEIYAIVKKC